jgi:hypothetical protein
MAGLRRARPDVASSLEAATGLALALERIRAQESERQAHRDRAMVDAVRAGARLSEVAAAAGLTRAAVSLVVRRSLPARPARGGPYARRRRTAGALDLVTEASAHLSLIRAEVDGAKVRRDEAIAAAIASGIGVRKAARALGMTAPTVSAIARLHAEVPTRG